MRIHKDVYLHWCLLCLLISLLVFIHHFYIVGRWYDIDDLLHHEVLGIGFIGGAIGFLISYLIGKLKEDN